MYGTKRVKDVKIRNINNNNSNSNKRPSDVCMMYIQNNIYDDIMYICFFTL